MKSSSKDDTTVKKKYVFFSDPDVIVQRATASAAAAQAKQNLKLHEQISNNIPSNLPIQFDLKGLENLLSYPPAQPYPFTFISAVKRKLALSDNSDTCKKAQDPKDKNAVDVSATVLKSSSTQSLYEVVQKMDFVRPLKVPDLKISTKKIDFSNRDNSLQKELVSPKFETPSKELIHDRTDKPSKSFERVQRRLDFSTSDVSSIINSEVEPLKVPNISMSSNLSKKKEYIRETSREKENRSKRIRKDDTLLSKQDDMAQDFFKRSRSPRHASRKDFSDNLSETAPSTKLKNDRLLFHMPRESDFGSTKPKTKNFATSTAKKDDKKHKSINMRSSKLRNSSLESKSRTCSNESLSERSSKLQDKITIREPRNMFENYDYKHKDDLHLLKQADDSKYMFQSENKQGKQYKVMSQSQGKMGHACFKEQTKRVPEKIKPSTSKMESKMYIMSFKESEDIESITDSNTSARTRSPNSVSTQQIKSKDCEKAMQSINLLKSNKISEDSKYTDDSLQQCNSSNIKKEDESFTQSITTTMKETSNNNESNLNDSILSDALLDPRRISFRDENRSPQENFCDLVTPDMNLMPRSKRKRQFIQNSTVQADSKCSKYNTVKTETEQGDISLLHPTALHMQFQAELHLLDSFNESLRQVMDVEKCIYNVKREQGEELPTQNSQTNDQVRTHFFKIDERNSDDMEHCSQTSKLHKYVTTDKVFPSNAVHHSTCQTIAKEFENLNKINKPVVKAVEVQTQTVNDMATQTDLRSTRRTIQSRCSEICGIPYERGFVGDIEVPQLSLDSAEQFEDLDQIEEISLPSKLRTMSEISLHETTSSIRTETGTEISISTRDVTCSFNKYLDLEIAQLIQDEKQRYDKIEMLFKSREKTLNDRTKKLVKLEEQKRALRDTGQDSRVSSVKKKQRALLLKLQQEKDEMNRLKELHKIASQERKLMLQKQRNMFNPQMSTKNILTKLKRSADSQSPRRLSGPMKGYDIRSNSSMSSLVDSDKSQHDRSQTDTRVQMSENELHFSKHDLPTGNKFTNFVEESASFLRFDKPSEAILSPEKCSYKAQKEESKSKYDLKSRKFEEKMPKADLLRLKTHQHSADPKLVSGHSMTISGKYFFEKEKSPDVSELLHQNMNKSISEHAKSESDTLVEELSKKSKSSQITDNHFQVILSPRERESLSKVSVLNSEIVPEEITLLSQDTVSKTSKSSQISEDILQTHSKSSKRSSKSIPTEMSKKTQYSSESKSNFKRKSSKCQKSKSSSSILTENILRSKSNSQISEEFIKHHNKRTKMEKEFIQADQNDENSVADNMDHSENTNSLQALSRHSKSLKDKSCRLSTDRIDDYESKENISSSKLFNRNIDVYDSSIHSQDKNVHNLDNISTKLQHSNFDVSQHSSGDSDRNCTKSVVIRSQENNLKTSKKLQQILNAREAALASRKNCVEEWMAWHAKLRSEEDRVARMEQAALKLVTTTSNVFSQQDTTVSSDTSDIDGRIELLTERLAERRIEMSRLKREARKQTKQKLRALEANLLNQIKKYDTTIHEMRKKLESKKGISKDSDKLGIESKSLADYKVPEIPLKRIQDIFKNSDLLRSRSESDLLCSKRLQTKDTMKSMSLLRNDNIETEFEKNISEKVTGSSRIMRTPEQLSSAKISTVNHSIQSIFDECVSEQIKFDKTRSASMSPVSDDVRSDKSVPYANKIYAVEIQNKQSISESKKNSVSEDIRTEISGQKSDADILTQSDSNLTKAESVIQSEVREYKSDFDIPSQQSQDKSISTQSGVDKEQDTLRSHVSSEKSLVKQSNTEVNTMSANEILDFSRKLDFLRLNNKNLNEDISSLENELKILSEIMSRFSKKSMEESAYELQSEEKSTSKDVSDVLLKSGINNEVHNVVPMKPDKNKNAELNRRDTDSDISQYLTNSIKLKSANSFNDIKNTDEKLDNVMSAIIPQDETPPSISNQEIDYKARSKEILNEIEKSIISEHIKATENDLSRTSAHDRKEKVSISSSLGTIAKSLSEIYSKATQSKENINATEDASEVIYTPEEDVNIEDNIVDSDSSGNQEILESNSIISEKSNSLGKDKSINLYANVGRNSPVNNILMKETQSESNNGTAFKKLPQNVMRQTVEEYVTELLKRQISPNSIETIESVNESINYAKDTMPDDKHQSISDSFRPVSKTDNFELASNQLKKQLDHDNKNDTSFILSESAKYKDISPKSVEEPTQEVFENVISFPAQDASEDESQQKESSMNKSIADKGDWTVSDSFDDQQDDINSEWEKPQNQRSTLLLNDDSSEFLDTKNISQSFDTAKNQDLKENMISDVEDVSQFIPKGESTNIDIFGIKLKQESYVEETNDTTTDSSNVISKDNNKEQNQEETEHTIETDEFQKTIYDSVVKILNKVEKSIESNSIKDRIEIQSENKENRHEIKDIVHEPNTLISTASNLKQKLQPKTDTKTMKNEEIPPVVTNNEQNITENVQHIMTDIESDIDINIHVEIKDDEDSLYIDSKSREIVTTELEPESVQSEIFPELEIDAEVELAEDIEESALPEDKSETSEKIIYLDKSLESIVEHDSSDGEQLDNLIEVAEGVLDIIEKEIKHSTDSTKSELISHDKIETQITDYESKVKSQDKENKVSSETVDICKTVEQSEVILPDTPTNIINKTFDILKDPEYEDISEESLEVSEIFDKCETQKSASVQKLLIQERYEAVQKSEEVLRILEEISQKSSTNSEYNSTKLQDKQVSKNDEQLQTELSNKDRVVASTTDDKIVKDIPSNEQLSAISLENQTSKIVAPEEEKRSVQIISSNLTEEKEKLEQDVSFESSESIDTPKGVSEIEMDSPRDPNDSKLDIDTLNDDLINSTNAEIQTTDSKDTFHVTPIVGTSEKDIEVMIDKLKASLEQPGLEVAELEAKLLRIEQLEIELEIKKLEAEEVSYYVREIPNKPPPPYTPPGGGARICAPLGSPSPPPAVIPQNIDELTAFTEKATSIIFKAKEAGNDIMSLEAPPEICELTKENDETVKKDRRIYNTFLFDLCKETIAEVYQAEYEKPGPSWTKPNVKTKPTIKLPKSVEELNEYVNKEVATLFGFKTKLQRENMVMRWSRKRRDRVDELLAREAQAEEDEWTKFHHDELAVKNGLTVAILDTLIMETVNVVKVIHAKKRKVMV